MLRKVDVAANFSISKVSDLVQIPSETLPLGMFFAVKVSFDLNLHFAINLGKTIQFGIRSTFTFESNRVVCHLGLEFAAFFVISK